MISYRYRTQEPFMIQERVLAVKPGGIAAVILLAILVLTVAAMIASGGAPPVIVVGILVILADFFFMKGLFVVNPNEARVVQLFGSYAGTVREPGLKWANPLFTKRTISLRVRNFEST